jgi:tryptophan 2,3-dioxygenase
LYYSEYLQLDKILDAQHPKSASQMPAPAHDEMLFIVVHQAFELWFLQVRYELGSIADYLKQDRIDDNTDEMSKIVYRLQRVVKIFKLINTQFDILETMTPLDFLEFRGLLAPASGFQSKQFKIIEAILGLRMDARHMPEHYKNTATHDGGFSQADYKEITEVEHTVSILQALKGWLARMPLLDDRYWNGQAVLSGRDGLHRSTFISHYFDRYREQQAANRDSMLAEETDEEKRAKAHEAYNRSIENFSTLFLESGTPSFASTELVSALFIMLYRHCPLLRLPYEMIRSLMEIDELITMWRYRHYVVVKKMIGTKPGTGGSVGAQYLVGAIQSNTVFGDLNLLATFFMEEEKLPTLPEELKATVNYRMQISDM